MGTSCLTVLMLLSPRPLVVGQVVISCVALFNPRCGRSQPSGYILWHGTAWTDAGEGIAGTYRTTSQDAVLTITPSYYICALFGDSNDVIIIRYAKECHLRHASRPSPSADDMVYIRAIPPIPLGTFETPHKRQECPTAARSATDSHRYPP